MDYLAELRKTLGLPTWEEATNGLRNGVTSIQNATKSAADSFDAYVGSQAQPEQPPSSPSPLDGIQLNPYQDQGLRSPVSGNNPGRDPEQLRKMNPTAMTVRG